MEFDPFGDVQACCANTLFPLGNVATMSIDEIWQGPRAELLRRSVLDGDLTLGCTVCRHRIDHDEAERPYEGYEFPLVEDDAGRWPYQLTFALQNTCNLACGMCGADRSSTIRSRRAHLPPLRDAYADPFFEQIVPYLQRCERVDFVGGEPFLIRGHDRIWDLMIDLGVHPACGITTNGTVWNERVERVLDAFDTDVRLSVDGRSAAVFEAIRVGAGRDQVYENLDRFHRYTVERGTAMIVNWSLVQQNWFELGEMLRWAEGRDIEVRVMTVIEPGFGVQRFDDAELGVVAEVLRSQSVGLRPMLERNGLIWDRQIEMVEAELARRRAQIPTRPYLEPPSSEHPATVAAAILGLLAPLADQGDSGPCGRSTAEVQEAAVADLLRWGTGRPDAAALPIGTVRIDAGGTVVHAELRSLVGGDPAPTDLGEVFELLREAFGGHLWLLDELARADRVDHTLFLGPEVRDKLGFVVRTSAVRDGDVIEVLIAVDDWFRPAPAPATRAGGRPVRVRRGRAADG
jgi:molybdenum cofactor biosynthesis enzyme MoaA